VTYCPTSALRRKTYSQQSEQTFSSNVSSQPHTSSASIALSLSTPPRCCSRDSSSAFCVRIRGPHSSYQKQNNTHKKKQSTSSNNARRIIIIAAAGLTLSRIARLVLHTRSVVPLSSASSSSFCLMSSCSAVAQNPNAVISY